MVISISISVLYKRSLGPAKQKTEFDDRHIGVTGVPRKFAEKRLSQDKSDANVLLMVLLLLSACFLCNSPHVTGMMVELDCGIIPNSPQKNRPFTFYFYAKISGLFLLW